MADISLLTCTYNRADDLNELLETALRQETEGRFSYEVLVVDNNSTDHTRSVVESYIRAGHQNLRYMFEQRQGKSNALNTGLSAASGSIYTIVDDDFILPSNWVLHIYNGFQEYPEASFISGKVLPLWKAQPPGWLTSEHWSAIALADYGEKVFNTTQDNQICLLACSFRLEHVLAVGGYEPALGPKKLVSAATEDLDVLKKLWKAGHHGTYLPDMAFFHKVAEDRLTRSYHRKWHTNHGRQYAIMRAEEVEDAKFRLFDIPGHLYRQAVADSIKWAGNMFTGRLSKSFLHETRLRFFLGFFQQRFKDFRASTGTTVPRELKRFIASLAPRRHRS